jgi:hypothetical protein
MLRHTRILALVALVLVVGAGAGCGSMATAPISTSSSAVATTPPDDAPASSTTSAPANPSVAPTGLLTPIAPILDGLLGLLIRVLNVVGDLGGTLTNGRHRLDIPAHAISGNAKVVLGVRSFSSPDCAIEILPSDKNHFDVPVRLTIDCRLVPRDRLATYVILWYNPATNTWVPVPGSTVDLTNKTVSAPLSHFSRYQVGTNDGKAGW